MLRHLASLLVGLSLVLLASRPATAQSVNPILPIGFQDLIVVGGFDQPTSFEFLPDGRIILTERRSGLLRLVVADTVHSSDPIGLLTNIESGTGEEGLLGLAIDPRWPAHPYIYVHYTAGDTALIYIERYTVTGDLPFAGSGELAVDTLTKYRILTAPNDATFHNGGTLEFGPDDMLYVALGDDGGNCAAMDLTQLKGKILRLDVLDLPAGPGGLPLYAGITPADNPFVANPDTVARLVYAYGVRNPFSMSIDQATGDLFVADVGSVNYEELNWITTGGVNYGWPLWEGPKRRTFLCPGADTTFMADPIAYYENPQGPGGASIITAGVYRAPGGASNPWPADYEGDALYGDFGQAFLRRIDYDGANWVPEAALGQADSVNWGRGEPWIADFHVGPDGSLWYVRMWSEFFTQSDAGRLRKIAYLPASSVSVPGVSTGLAVRPQPSRGAVQMSLVLDAASDVQIDVLDVSGRSVRAIEQGRRFAAGSHVVTWDGRGASGQRVAPGIYFARVRTDAGQSIARIVRLD